MAAMVNMSNLLNGKDSRWLQLEVCREFQRNKCSRPDTECKFAHPPANVEVQNGRVTACYDSIKGRCNREKPPCKYFHPPQHLKDQLLINGRNHLALKNALMQQMGMAPTQSPAIIPSPLQPMTANRFLPASNPYNPYFTTGALLPTTILGPEHAATALASTTTQMQPQAVSLTGATNNAVQQQKRNDRVQNTPTTSLSQTPTSNSNSISNSSVPLISSASILANLVESGKKRSADCLQMNQMKLTTPYYYERFIYPGLLPYKRPAPDKPAAAGIQAVYQPSAAAYQQLIQLQSAQQSYVPVSSQQNSIIQSSPSSKAIIPSNIIENNSLSKSVAVTTSSNNLAAPDDDGDSENVLTVQNAKTQINANGLDVNGVAVVASNNNHNNNNNSNSNSDLVVEENNNKTISDIPNGTSPDVSSKTSVEENATKTSIQSSIDESNLNAISFNSATSSSPAAATLPAIFTTTSSITTSVNNYSHNQNNSNNNNNIYSRKNSFTTPNQQLINNCSSKTPLTSLTSNSGKVDNVPDLINASSLNNPQAALLSAVFYNQPYQQLTLTPNLYSDPAQQAKEMAQKNYANALKFAAFAQSPQAMAHTANMNAKNQSTNPLLSYSGVALSNNNAAAAAAMLQSGQLSGSSATTPRLPTQIASSTRSPFMPATTLTRPMQNPYQHTFIRPQLQSANLTNAAANPYFAAHQQFLNQQNFLYSGLTSPMTSPQLTATSVASQSNATPFAATASYPFSALGQAQALQHAQSLPTSMMQVPQITSQSSQTGSTSAVVLNPYKKMKTS